MSNGMFVLKWASYIKNKSVFFIHLKFLRTSIQVNIYEENTATLRADKGKTHSELIFTADRHAVYFNNNVYAQIKCTSPSCSWNAASFVCQRVCEKEREKNLSAHSGATGIDVKIKMNKCGFMSWEMCYWAIISFRCWLNAQHQCKMKFHHSSSQEAN